MSPKDREEALRRYVLGTSPEEEGEALDAELAREGDSTFQALEAAEAELLDAFAAGELSPGEREQVEETYAAAPPLRRRLAFAVALRRRATPAPAQRSRLPAWLPLAAAIAVLLLGIVFVLWRDQALRRQIRSLQTAQVEAGELADRLSRQLSASRAEVDRLQARLESALREAPVAELPRAAVAVARLVLRPGLLREPSSVPELALAGSVEWAELELELPEEPYDAYRVELQAPEGRSLWRSERLAAPRGGTRRSVTVRVPAEVLTDGTHVVLVSGYTPGGGAEPAAEYTFRARRRR